MAGNLNIKVAVKVRPLENQTEKNVIDIIEDKEEIVVKGTENFTFDYVFSAKSTINEVYNKSVKPFINNILKGYNVTVLAYGQADSGKTHTMGTCYSCEGEMGVIPRTIIEIFDLARDHFSYDCKITVSFLEVLNDIVYDLFAGKPKEQCMLHEILEDAQKGVYVPGISEINAKSARQVLDLLQKISSNRARESTPTNRNSSRSHAIFSLNISMNHKTDKKENKQAKLLLVDLAGSEKSDALGKNGIIIPNNGLSTLNSVINCLGDTNGRDGNIPYEESNLTSLLKDSLGGNSITLMIACISPAERNTKETLSTLKYASKVKKIENKPIVHQDIRTEDVIEVPPARRAQIFKKFSDPVVINQTKLIESEVLSLFSKLQKITKQMFRSIDDRTTFSDNITARKKQIENDLKRTDFDKSNKDDNLKNIFEKLSAIDEEFRKLENIEETFRNEIESKNERIYQLEEEIRILKETIDTKMTENEIKPTNKRTVTKNKKRISARRSNLTPTENDNLSENNDSPVVSKVSEKNQKLNNEGVKRKSETLEIADKENISIKEPKGRSKISKKKVQSDAPSASPLENSEKLENSEAIRNKARNKALSEKQKIKENERDSVKDDEPTKQAPSGGCTCKTDCSRKICGCKKVGRGCDSSCKCKHSMCRNRSQTEASMEMEKTESVELPVDDGVKRKKVLNENVSKRRIK